MKSLKALEQKYKLINEAGAPVPTTAVPRAAQPAAATAAPAAQPSILTPEELKSLNAADSPVQPNKIDAIAKDPQQLKAFEQNELPDIINGLVASIAQTHPEALKELLDAAKTNDVNKVNSVLAKYAKIAPAAPAPATPVTPAVGTAPAPVTAQPAAAESTDLNTEAPLQLPAPALGLGGSIMQGVKQGANSVKDWLIKVFNFFKENPKLGYAALGFIVAGPLGAAALPLLVTAIEKGSFNAADKDTTVKNPAITKEVTNIDAWDALKKQFVDININLAKTGKDIKKIKIISIGVIPDLPGAMAAYNITLTPQEVKRIINDAPLNLISDGNDPDEPQFQLTGGSAGAYKMTIIKDGNLWTVAQPNPGKGKNDEKEGKKGKGKGQGPSPEPRNVTPPRLALNNSGFNYNASKVLKEYYRNSKPLPIETANKK